MNFTLDVTPNFSFNTVQFQSEVANVIVTSLLITFILSNIGSIVSKITLRVPLTTFPFDSFRRFVIFETTNNPFRLLNWLIGKRFRKKEWQPNSVKTKPKYLLLPLSARMVLIVATVASIAISIPTQRVLSGCENGDFRLMLNISRGEIFGSEAFRCQNALLTSRLGLVVSSLEYCSFLQQSRTLFNSSTIVARVRFLADGVVAWEFETQEMLIGYVIFMHWTRDSGRTLNSLFNETISPEQVIDALVETVVQLGLQCERSETIPMETTDEVVSGAFVSLRGCQMEASALAFRAHLLISSSLSLERVEEPQARHDISTGQKTTACPIDVAVQQPYVNILPLVVLLVAIFIVNLMFTVITARYGGVLENYFHVVKELFGYDCMSNPLEESLGAANECDELAWSESGDANIQASGKFKARHGAAGPNSFTVEIK